MSTRSFIGRYSEGCGRYVHWDGYPSNVGTELCKIIKRDGINQALSMIVDKEYVWSTIDSEADGSTSFPNDKRFKGIVGYGQICDNGDTFFVERVGDANTQYGYLVEDNGDIHVYSGRGEISCVNAFDSDAVEQMTRLE